jgi:hypothetical protein
MAPPFLSSALDGVSGQFHELVGLAPNKEAPVSTGDEAG